MIVRRMIKEDLQQVCDIESETFSMPWTFQSFLDSLLIKDNIYLVAVENNSIIGYCGVWVVAKEGQINNIAVRKQNQNLGVGNQMLQFLFKEGKAEKIEQFTLEVRKSNVNAINLYNKFGFVNVGIRPSFYEKPQEDAVIMTVITSRKEESALI